MLDTFQRKVSVLSDTPLQGIWMFLPFSGHFLYPANHICGLPQSNKKQEKDKIPGPAFISIHTVRGKLLLSVTQNCYIASPSLTNLRGCVTYFWWDWRRGGWVGCEWQIWLRSFASSAERGGTGGWDGIWWGRRCHSISSRRRREGRVGPPAEAALLHLPMVLTTIHHTFRLF